MKAQDLRDRARATLAREAGVLAKPHGQRIRVALAFPEHLPHRDVEPRLPDRLPSLQRDGRRGLRAGVPAAAAGTAGPAGVRTQAAHDRVTDAGQGLRRLCLVRLVRMGLPERPDAAAAGGHAHLRRGTPGRARSAGRARWRGHLRQPGAAGAVCRRDCRRRRRATGADPRAAHPRSHGSRVAAARARPGPRFLRAVGVDADVRPGRHHARHDRRSGPRRPGPGARRRPSRPPRCSIRRTRRSSRPTPSSARAS